MLGEEKGPVPTERRCPLLWGELRRGRAEVHLAATSPQECHLSEPSRGLALRCAPLHLGEERVWLRAPSPSTVSMGRTATMLATSPVPLGQLRGLPSHHHFVSGGLHSSLA